MNTWNAYRRLLQLLPEPSTDVGTITATSSDGCTVTLLSGEQTQVRGRGSIGDPVYIRDGVIQGPAPVLQTVEIEV
ncbi:hypothetical protein MARPU_09465 [Marichromatium purpuratum 984]|uniref:Uncharacterized protein n=1 Tax=Marichromatium purpuratum 984 TaxID=765910 RepID=W0DZM8_MARPU|nr:hypothetical protein [Marichromatium purpuratum]AHF04070.1 hypothetical protein MARPU_09465 [Marichromatium purpuratum 984]